MDSRRHPTIAASPGKRPPTFLLIDHSLKGVGGHHFEYAAQVLAAADEAGFQPVVAAHRRFRKHGDWPRHWRVYPLFRQHGYHRFALRSGRYPLPSNPLRPRHRSGLREWWEHWQQQRRVCDLAAGCAVAIDRCGLSPGDQVFLPTVTEFDLVGLLHFLRSEPSTADVDWHLQFHDGFLTGRQADHGAQGARLAAVREHFRELLAEVPRHRLHFYSITPKLTDQFNQLGVGRFELLRYAVSDRILNRPLAPAGVGTRQVLCGLSTRDQNAPRCLTNVLEELWDRHVAQGAFQLRVRVKRQRDLPPIPSARSSPPLPPVVRLPHSMQAHDYAEMVCGTHIGLLLYDNQHYYAKCSGMLTELLCAGVPVIVPAGCWLSEQFAERGRAHVEHMAATLPLLRQFQGEEIPWRPLRDEPNSITAEFPVPVGAREVVVRCQALHDSGWEYARWTCETFDARGQSLGHASAIVEAASGTSAALLFPVPATASQLRLTTRNAFTANSEDMAAAHPPSELRPPSPLSPPAASKTSTWLGHPGLGHPGPSHPGPGHPGNVVLSLHTSGSFAPGHCPSGSVGLAAADPQQIPRLLAEMLDHYEHYQRTAQEFAGAYGKLHDPRTLVKQLIDRGQATRMHRPAA
jgi:hypothetical protein